MKQFFKMTFASALGVFVAAVLISIVFVFSLIGIAASMSSTPEYTPKSNTVYKLTLNGTLSDNVQENPFAALMGETESALSLKAILSSIQTAKENSNIKGIYLDAQSLSAGTSSLDAIRRALIDFKESGKFIIAYGDNFTQGGYYLCSVADKVFLNPQGSLSLIGMASQTMFYKGLLEKIGVEMLIFKVGTYKGAVEPFMLDKLSDANREQIQSYVSGTWNNVVNDIATSRNIPVEDINNFANQGLAYAAASKAVECKLVDELKYRSEADAYVKELAEQNDKQLKTASLSQINSIKTTAIEHDNKIAILYAEGEITDAASATPYNTEATITEKLADELIKLKDDEDVKAVILRVNSPGGSAYVSEQIWRQVVELRKVKPIVISMGDVAASGGYYISCAANKIIAEPNTLTGSIGIFGMVPNTTGLFNKLALTADVVKTNTYADMGDMTRPMREDEKALVQASIERGYDTFLTRCADGRGMSKDAINEIGQGRVWTGEQAKERGLVDELGGIEKAIEAAASLAELDEYSLTYVSGSKDFFEELIEKQLGEVKASIVKNVLGSDYIYFKQLNTIKSATGIKARLPYDIQPL